MVAPIVSLRSKGFEKFLRPTLNKIVEHSFRDPASNLVGKHKPEWKTVCASLINWKTTSLNMFATFAVFGESH